MRPLRWIIATPLRRVAVGSTIAVLIPVGALAWWLGSPLFFDTTVNEEFPLSSSAVLPDDITQEEAEAIMEDKAKLDTSVNEQMPQQTSEPSSTEEDPTVDPGQPVATPAPPPEATPTAAPMPVALASGSFRDADSFHKGAGQAVIYELTDGSRVLRLQDLRVTNGPDLHVLLSRHPDPASRDQVNDPGYVDLGSLKGNLGNQNYEIPADLDVSEYSSVVIYCVPFHVLFSVAPLSPASP